eukprot:1157183-Pelagomonas_calceolata.AAC.4
MQTKEGDQKGQSTLAFTQAIKAQGLGSLLCQRWAHTQQRCRRRVIVQHPNKQLCRSPLKPATHNPTIHRAQPPSRYGALVKHEEGDSKEEVPGSNP